jgi:hypothetical protein
MLVAGCWLLDACRWMLVAGYARRVSGEKWIVTLQESFKILMEQKRKIFRRFFFGALAIFAVYAAADLFWPVNTDLRQFDPVALGKLETDMWRSYYDRKPFKLFFELTEMLRTQYKFPWLRSYLGAYYATKAAFVFKDGKQRADYEKALPALESYFATIRRTGNIPFEVPNAAKLELEWWIVHRQREQYGKAALDTACADAAAAIYLVSPDSTLEHGRLRADAMVIRDDQAAAGGVREEEWAQIDRLLQGCYRSLRRVVTQTVDQ